MCGVNDGQHIYVDAGANTADSAVLAGEFKGTTTARYLQNLIFITFNLFKEMEDQSWSDPL